MSEVCDLLPQESSRVKQKSSPSAPVPLRPQLSAIGRALVALKSAFQAREKVRHGSTTDRTHTPTLSPLRPNVLSPTSNGACAPRSVTGRDSR
jgi:hypothetical protein